MLSCIAWWFRTPLLRSVGQFLIAEDPLEKADAIVVLSGSPVDRGAEAARLYRAGWAPKVLALGGYIPEWLALVDIDSTESALTRKVLSMHQVPDSAIIQVKKATSTMEESKELLAICQTKGWQTIVVVSDKFHTLRIRKTFRKTLQPADIKLLVHGAPSVRYSEAFWWRYEAGLLMVNNEYLKLGYYFRKGYLD